MAELVSAQRISVFLPANDGLERLAAAEVLEHMQGMFPGYTFSTLDEPVFKGTWFDSNIGRFVSDQIAIAFAGVFYQSDSAPALLAAIEDIRRAMFGAYEDAGSPQDDVWVTVEAVKTSS